MAETTETCGTCGGTSTFTVPDDHDGSTIAWECPLTVAETFNPGTPDEYVGERTCGARNTIPGVDPVAAIHEAARAEASDDVQVITDGDVGSIGDIHV